MTIREMDERERQKQFREEEQRLKHLSELQQQKALKIQKELIKQG